MMNYEVEMEQWPYKGTDATLLGKVQGPYEE